MGVAPLRRNADMALCRKNRQMLRADAGRHRPDIPTLRRHGLDGVAHPVQGRRAV